MSQVELDTSLGYLLKQASSTLHASMDAVLRPLGMTITEYSCLELLAQRPGMSNSALARGAFVSRQSMNVLLRSMERSGFISRAQQPQAGRILPTELTPAGEQRLRAASSAVRAVEQQMISGFDAQRQAELGILLKACIEALAAPLSERETAAAP
ncbi:MAG: MarR family transcriptional regulator [Subtercola sp.]|nr:MarR family transcriptional regulator [Subtercola sp.]